LDLGQSNAPDNGGPEAVDQTDNAEKSEFEKKTNPSLSIHSRDSRLSRLFPALIFFAMSE